MIHWLPNFINWWLCELSFLLPGGIRQLFNRHQSTILTAFENNAVVFDRIQVGQYKRLGVFPLLTPDGATATAQESAVQKALKTASQQTPKIALDLPSNQILRRTITFPSATEENLQQVVQYEMERRTPFKPDEVYFTASVTGRSPETQEIEVALAVVPRATVDEAVEQMANLGLRPERVGASAPGLSAAEGVNFLPSDGTRKTPRWGVAGTGALGLVTAVLLIAAILLPLEIKRERAAQLSADVVALRKNAVAASRLTDEIEALRVRNQFIQTQRNSAQPAVKVLDDLTRLLPDDAWVFQLRLQKGQVSAQGYTTAVSALVERIESDPRFRNVAVQSRVTRDPKTGMERFHLTFDLAGTEA